MIRFEKTKESKRISNSKIIGRGNFVRIIYTDIARKVNYPSHFVELLVYQNARDGNTRKVKARRGGSVLVLDVRDWLWFRLRCIKGGRIVCRGQSATLELTACA